MFGWLFSGTKEKKTVNNSSNSQHRCDYCGANITDAQFRYNEGLCEYCCDEELLREDYY